MNSSSDYYYLRDTLKDLLLARSVKRGDFVLASGRRSSFYVDARRTTMSGDGLAVIGGLGLDRMAVRGWTPRAVGGLTLGADPIAYALALTARRRGQLLAIFYYRTPEARARRLAKVVEEAAALAEKKADQRDQDQ